MDKEWTKHPRFSKEYINGVQSFLDFAYTKGRPQGDEILCPCTKCRNCCWTTRNVVADHLIAKGFLKGYDVWVHHGEPIRRRFPMEIDDDMEDQEYSNDDIGGLLCNTFRSVAEEEGVSEGPNEEARKFYDLVNEAKQVMKKKASLTKKMNAQDKGKRSTSHFEPPEVRSSVSRKQFLIKLAKLINNLGGTNVDKTEIGGPSNNEYQEKGSNRPSFMIASQEQFNLSNSGASGQSSLNSNKVLHPTKKRSGVAKMTQPNVPDQNQDPTNFVNATKKLLTTEALMAKSRRCRKFMIQSKGSIQIQDPKRQPMKKAAVDNSRIKQTMKNSVAGDDNSRAKQQPMRRAVAENDNSRANKQSMDRVVGEKDKTRTRKQLENRAVLEDDRPRTMQESAMKKTKILPMCRSMLIDEFLKENEEVGEEELGEECSDEEQNVVGQEESAYPEEGGKTKGTSKKRTRGPTQCLKIHARHHNDRHEVVLDDDGEPIGPTGQIVSDLSHFLGTIARNAKFCPLIYTNFKALVKDNEDLIWGYVNDKYIIPEKGRRAVFSRINDAWRRYKCCTKRNYFLKYSSMKERLKNRPTTIPEAHFKQLMTYWRNSTIQSISQTNAKNRAKLKYIHRTGPVNFARIRAQLRATKENGEEVTQPEMFVATRQSRKGKEVDKETQSVIPKLQDSVKNSSESETFQSLFGKEKSGKVHCYGRTVTPSMFKRKEEIAAIKKQHSNEMTSVKREMEGLKMLVKSLLLQQNPNFDEEEVNDIMGTALGNENSATPHSSTSNHVRHPEKCFALQCAEEGDTPQGLEEECEDEEDIPQGIEEEEEVEDDEDEEE
ncbi:uncharacterized protein LOC130729257 isoform X3 [Lotus japonicus]|uniref:uncharacterized protein LOC130729257 isoform X3 n=1 Tax=Lotus japonicus TaxID=34305 RepID=UPI00258B1EB0|nr:uncharacterized protein LOC130729257 isoform X3 [Lotus japonicus]